MITVKDLYDHDFYSSILQKHFSSNKMVRENGILPVNDEILHCLAEKAYNVAKMFFNASDESFAVGIESDAELVKTFKEENKIDETFYVFCGSRNAFAETFELDKYSPSVAQLIIAGYEMMQSIKYFGPGKGSFVVLKPFTKINKTMFDATIASRSDFYNNPKNQKHILKIYQQDCSYYYDYIQQLEAENNHLNEKLKEASYKQFIQSQMTWS